MEDGSQMRGGEGMSQKMQHYSYQTSLYGDLEVTHTGSASVSGSFGSFSIASKLGLKMPNLAPEVDASPPVMPSLAPLPPAPTVFNQEVDVNPLEPKKKKYAKEAWPGKKPTPSLLVL